MNFLCIGNIAYDITYRTNTFPKENTKYRINEKIECSGGQAATAACLLSSWGMPTFLMGTLGNDEYGTKVIKELKKFKVNTKYIKINKAKNTTLSFIINNKQNGSRTIITHKEIKPISKYINLEEKIDVIIMDSNEYKLSKKIINNTCAIKIMNAERNNKSTIELSKLSDYVICSKQFAEKYTKTKFNLNDNKNVKNIYQKLKNDLNTNIIITLEEAGALYLYENQLKIMPSIKTIANDTTGAGDIFLGTFAYFISQNYNIEQAIMYSNISAGLSTNNIGSKNSIPKLERVIKYCESK